MGLSSVVAAALGAAGLRWEADVPLAKRTYWRVGGPADALVFAGDLDELCRLQQLAAAHAVPVFPLGVASNLLVSDAGVRGLVLVLDRALAEIGLAEERVVAGAGARLSVLLARAKTNGWTGLEWAAGIPGTVGGAVRMNAGSALGECKDALVDVVVAVDGAPRTLSLADLNMSYRTTHLPSGAIVASARFQPTGGDAAASEARVSEFLAKRKATQPLDLPSCGSTFRNPQGDAAGRLIEASGLKGFTVGGAQVSLKHANFVVNLGGATATDIRRVIEHVEDTVSAAQGVHLEREVIYAGSWDGWVRGR